MALARRWAVCRARAVCPSGWIPFGAGPSDVSAAEAGRIILLCPVVMPGCDQRLLRAGLLCGPGMAALWVDTREMRSWA